MTNNGIGEEIMDENPNNPKKATFAEKSKEVNFDKNEATMLVNYDKMTGKESSKETKPPKLPKALLDEIKSAGKAINNPKLANEATKDTAPKPPSRGR